MIEAVELTAFENLLSYGMLHRVTNRNRDIRAALTMVDLRDRKDSEVIHHAPYSFKRNNAQSVHG